MDARQVIEFFCAVMTQGALVAMPVFLIVLTITLLGRRWLAPWARQALWSLVLVRLLLPASFASPLSLQPEALGLMSRAYTHLKWYATECTVDTTTRGGHISVRYLPVIQETTRELPAADSELLSLNWEDLVLPGALFSGMLLIAGWTIITTIRLRRWVRSGAECRRDDWLALLEEGKQKFGINASITLRTLPRLTGPATFGWWRPTILLPEDAYTWSSVEMRHVLWHEMAHIARRDVAKNWGLALVRMLQWWNPMFWWTQRAWLAEGELACDAMVLRRLEGDDIREYGQTLFRFVERLARKDAGLPTIAPNFVFFWGRKRMVRRRLEELPRLARPERTWRRWLTIGLIGAFAISSLTDAAYTDTRGVQRDSAAHSAPVELPDETTWELSSPNGFLNSDQLVTRTYTVADLVDMLREKNPKLTAETALEKVRQIIEDVCESPTNHNPGNLDPAKQKAASTVREFLKTQSLIIRAPHWQHEEVTQLLKFWRATGDLRGVMNGMRRINIQSTMVTTSFSLKDLLPGKGGVVLNASPGGEHPALDFSARESRVKYAWPIEKAQPWAQDSVPTFMRILNADEARKLVGQLNRNDKNKVLVSPKISALEGVSALFESAVVRPFVTGLNAREDGSLEPRVSTLPEGLQLKVRSQLSRDRKSVELIVEYQHSEVLDVEVLQTSNSGKPVSVQFPQVSRSLATMRATVPTGHSLLLAPLRRDQKGQLNFCLVRPELVP